MQGFIHKGRVHKPGKIPEFFKKVPEMAPHCVEEPMHVHRFVEGHHPTAGDIPQILKACSFWNFTGALVPTQEYKRYILDHAYHGPYKVILKALDLIPDKLPECIAVHGDMTLENVVLTPDVVFIDPGRPLLRTPALDRGKLLQSVVMKWEKRDWANAREMPTWANTIDLAFLVTHWVRLQKHQTETESGFAVLESLLERQLSAT